MPAEILLTVALALMMTGFSGHAQTNAALSVIHRFSPRVSLTNADGAFPRAALLLGADGSFYGTTFQGGAYGFGTIFRVTTSGDLTTLAHFSGSNGRGPTAPLVFGPDGAMYGTTQNGGPANLGSVFRINTNGVLTSLHFFSGTEGAYPAAGLVQGFGGALYGTAQDKGPGDAGTVFKIEANGNFQTLLSFSNYNGAHPKGALLPIPDGAGNFFGTTDSGGDFGAGTVFKMAPSGVMLFSSSFNYAIGFHPQGALIQGRDGNFHGTTRAGGPGNYTNGFGTVFQMTLAGELTSSATFNGTNGNAPESTLLEGRDGAFYGTTAFGSVFRIGADGIPVALVSCVASNGLYPWGLFPRGSLTEGPDGNLYGVMEQGGGEASQGLIYRLNIRPFCRGLRTLGGYGQLAWDVIPGLSYQLEQTTDLREWIAEGIPATASGASLTWSNISLAGPQRFYRLRLMP